MKELIEFLEKEKFTIEAQRFENNNLELSLSRDYLYLLNNNNFFERFVEVLKITSTITYLNLTGNHINHKGLKTLLDGIKEHNITFLYLGWNKIGNKGSELIAEFLQTNKSLISLGVGSNDITEKGAELIIQALKVNDTLSSLDLRYSKIGEKGITLLAEILQINKTINCIDLWGYEISNKEMYILANALNTNSALRSLLLGEDDGFCDGSYPLLETNIGQVITTFLDMNKNVTQEKANLLNAEGDSFFKDEQYNKAIEKYNAAIAMYPQTLYFNNKIKTLKVIGEENISELENQLNFQMKHLALDYWDDCIGDIKDTFCSYGDWESD